MSEEELEQVAGGDEGEKYDDYHFLGKSGLLNNYDTFDPYAFHDNNTLIEGWGRAGIKCIPDENKPNQYFFYGKKISRDEAVKYATDFVSSHGIPIVPLV